MESLETAVANNLRRLRRGSYLTIRELSEKSGISKDAILAIELRDRPARPYTIRKLAQALKVEPEALGIRSVG
jgi:transcriptional regulator with XRE-family HTH domain